MPLPAAGFCASDGPVTLLQLKARPPGVGSILSLPVRLERTVVAPAFTATEVTNAFLPGFNVGAVAVPDTLITPAPDNCPSRFFTLYCTVPTCPGAPASEVNVMRRVNEPVPRTAVTAPLDEISALEISTALLVPASWLTSTSTQLLLASTQVMLCDPLPA